MPVTTSQDIQRKCKINNNVMDCTHHTLKFRPRTDWCPGCIIASHNGGHAIDLPQGRSKPEATPPQSSQS